MSLDCRPVRPRVVVLLTLIAVVPFAVALVLQAARDEAEPVRASAPGELVSANLPDELEGSPGPRIRLRDAEGDVFDTKALAGTPYAVTFLFTRCPDVCPLIGQEIRAALDGLGPLRDRVAVAAISVDPRGDTPEAVRAWTRRQRLPEQFRYLIGSERELQPVWDAFYAAPQMRGRPETSTHTAAISLFDGRGRWRGRFSAGEYLDPADLAHDLRLLVRESAGAAR